MLPGLPANERALVYVELLALVVLAARLIASRLYLTYRYFSAFVGITLVQTVGYFFVPFNTNVYRNFFVITEILTLCCYVLVVLELYYLVLRGLTGISKISSRFIRVTVGGVTLISLLMLPLEGSPTNLTGKLFLVERAVFLSLLLFLLAFSIFLLYYPVPLNRNVIVYSAGYVVYFLTKAATLFLRNTGFHWDRDMSLTLMITSTACLVLWAAALSRAGEEVIRVVGHSWNRRDEERLMAQLKAIDARLVRATQK